MLGRTNGGRVDRCWITTHSLAHAPRVCSETLFGISALESARSAQNKKPKVALRACMAGSLGCSLNSKIDVSHVLLSTSIDLDMIRLAKISVNVEPTSGQRPPELIEHSIRAEYSGRFSENLH